MLARIPVVVFADYDCEVLVVDDGSEDRTFEIARVYQSEHPEIRMTVLRNVHDQGCGGIQKVGYRFAIDSGFDFVAMVHVPTRPRERVVLAHPTSHYIVVALCSSGTLSIASKNRFFDRTWREHPLHKDRADKSRGTLKRVPKAGSAVMRNP